MNYLFSYICCMIFFRVSFFLVFVINFATAQIITGRVLSSNREPLTPVSVILQNSKGTIASTTTNEKGYFRFTFQPENHHDYVMKFSLVGYQSKEISFEYPTDTSVVNQIILEEDKKTLAEVIITGKPPLVIRKNDRNIIIIENSTLSNGFSGAEVLQRLPGVWVDNMGNVRLKGNQPVTIMVNDVVQRLDAEELADYLRSLKSENIGRIEIIPNPPSEFEAGGAGGIIHIILKKGKRNGWNGSLNTDYSQQTYKPYYSVGATLNFQLNKLYLSGSYNFSNDHRRISEKTSITYPNSSSFENLTDRYDKIQRQQYRFVAIYDLSSTQSLSLQSSLATTNFQQLFQSIEIYTSDTQSYGKANTVKQRFFNSPGITLNYSFKPDTSGSILKVLADFSKNLRDENSEYNKTNNDQNKQRFWRTNVPINTKIFSIQSDYTKVFNPKMILTSGIKYAAIDRSNQLTTEDFSGTLWTLNSGQSNHFLYTEKILMLYTSAERNFKQAAIKVGLRTEETLNKGNEVSSSIKSSRKYPGLFPSLFVMQTLNAEKGMAITASYSHRLTRPRLNELNPARYEFSNYTSVTGNPDLQPQYSHHFNIAYQLVKNHSIEAYFTRTNNFIALSANPGANNSIHYYFENTSSTTEYGVEYNSTITPVKVWTIITNLTAYHSAYTYNQKPYQKTSFYASSLQTLTFTNIVDIDFIVDYRSPYIYTNLYTYGNFNMDIGFVRKLIHSKAKLRLNFTDILNTSREKEWTEEKGNTISFYRKRPTRSIRLTFTCQFSSGKKMQPKAIDTGGQEERRRIGN